MQPTLASIIAVIEFSRKTGDYGSLSLTDLKVLALTYTLETEHVGTNHLSDTPTVRPTVEITKPQKLVTAEGESDGKKVEVPAGQNIVGFVHPKYDEDEENEASEVDVNNLEEQLKVTQIDYQLNSIALALQK